MTAGRRWLEAGYEPPTLTMWRWGLAAKYRTLVERNVLTVDEAVREASRMYWRLFKSVGGQA